MNTNYSSRVARYAAFSLDSLVLGILQSVISFILQAATRVLTAPSVASSGLVPLAAISVFGPSILLPLLITPLYFWLSTYFYGKTIGKKFFGLEVVDAKTGRHLSLWKSFVREVLGKFISSLFLGIGYVWILFDKKRQGWHDKFASDVVIAKEPLVGGKKVVAYILFILALILPVIAIIGILAAVTLIGINPQGQLQKASDTKVRADVVEIGHAMEAYHARYNYYPNTIQNLVTSGELSTLPQAPSGYMPYFVSVDPFGCTTALKNCNQVSVGGLLKQPAQSANNYWCYHSFLKSAQEESSCVTQTVGIPYPIPQAPSY